MPNCRCGYEVALFPQVGTRVRLTECGREWLGKNLPADRHAIPYVPEVDALGVVSRGVQSHGFVRFDGQNETVPLWSTGVEVVA